MDILSTILHLSITQMLVVALAVGLLQKMGVDVVGFLQSFFNKNGKNGNVQTQRLSEIEGQLSSLMGNHVEHLQKGIDKLVEMQEAENITLALMNKSLEDIKQYIQHD